VLEKAVWYVILGLLGVLWVWLFRYLADDSLHQGMFLFFSIVAAAGWRR
jgi:hypothetical protein